MDIAIITMAKLNSKRCYQKNVRMLGGKPLIRWTVDLAKRMCAGIGDLCKFHVYARDKEILDIIKDCQVIKAPEKYFSDDMSINDQFKYIHKKVNADYYVLLQPTQPFREIGCIIKYIRDFIGSNYHSAFTIRRKDRLNYYMDGVFYIFHKRILTKYNEDIITDNCRMYLNTNPDYVDIDTEENFKKAENIVERWLEDENKDNS